jgi:hypothetical protein
MDPRRDINLVGCLTDDELFNGATSVRARKPEQVKPEWWRGIGTAFNHSEHPPSKPSSWPFGFETHRVAGTPEKWPPNDSSFWKTDFDPTRTQLKMRIKRIA